MAACPEITFLGASTDKKTKTTTTTTTTKQNKKQGNISKNIITNVDNMINKVLKVHFVILTCYFYDISRCRQNKHLSKFLVDFEVAFVSYARFTVSYCCRGHYVVIIMLT